MRKAKPIDFGVSGQQPKPGKSLDLLLRAKALLSFGSKPYIPSNAVTYEVAVRQFLGNMLGVSARTFPQWQRTLEDGLAEHGIAALGHSGLLDMIPVDDFYFVGFTALEAAKLPALYPPHEAEIIYGEIGDQIDKVAGRYDRVMSDLFFGILGRLNLLRISTAQKMPYDKIAKVLLKRLIPDDSPQIHAILDDKALRLGLAEPFALHAQDWWKPFQAQFILYQPHVPDDSEEIIKAQIEATAAKQKPLPKRRLWRRASSMFKEPA